MRGPYPLLSCVRVCVCRGEGSVAVVSYLLLEGEIARVCTFVCKGGGGIVSCFSMVRGTFFLSISLWKGERGRE